MIVYVETLELMNSFMKLFPMCNNRDQLANQSNMIGPAKGAKRFVSQLSTGKTKAKVYRSAVDARHKQEKDVIYEMFSLLGTYNVVSGRIFNCMTVKHGVERCANRKNLRDPKVEKRVTGK
jgi:hypothetical protein